MSNLMVRIIEAQSKKPKFGDPCNSCGWCCMTEVCALGQASGAGETIPCKHLTSDHLCGLASKSDYVKKMLSIGVGCDAKTQNEMLAEYGAIVRDSI